MSADFDAGSIEGTLDLDILPFRQGLDKARAEADKFEKKHITPHLGLDTKDFDVEKDKADIELDKLGVKKSKPKVELTGVPALLAKLGLVKTAMGGAGLGAVGMLVKVSLLTGGVLALAATLGPITAALIGFGAAGLVAFGGMIPALGLFAFSMVGAVKVITAANKAGKVLTGWAGVAQKGLKTLGTEWDSLQKIVRPALFKMLADTFKAVGTILPMLAPLLKTTTDGMAGLVHTVLSLTQQPVFKDFLHELQDFMQGFLAGAGPAIGNLLSTFMHLFIALRPVMSMLGRGISDMLSDWEKMSEELDKNGMGKFVKRMHRDLPPLGRLFKDVFGTLAKLGRELEPLAMPATKFIDALLRGLGNLNLKPIIGPMRLLLQNLRKDMPMIVSDLDKIAPVIGKVISGFAKITSTGKGLNVVLGVMGGLWAVAKIAGFVKAVKGVNEALGISTAVTAIWGAITGGAETEVGLAAGVAAVEVSALDTALAILTAPVTLIVAGIVALVVVIIEVVKHFKGLRKAAVETFNAVKNAAVVAFHWVKNAAETAVHGVVAAFDSVTGSVTAVWDDIKNGVSGAIHAVTSTLSNAAHDVAQFFIDLNKPFVGFEKWIGSVFLSLITTDIGVIKALFRGLGKVATWLFEHAIKPAFHGIKTAIGAVKDWFSAHVVRPMKTEFHIIGDAATWLWKNALKPAWDGIKTAISTVWNWIHQNVIGPMKTEFHIIGDAATWLWKNAIKPAWNGVRDVISDVWNWIHNTLVPSLKRDWADVEAAFEKGVQGIKNAWSDLKNAAMTPVKFVVDHVINPLIGGWDTIAKAFGGTTVAKIPGFAKGGIVNTPTAIVGEGDPRHPEYVIPTDPSHRKRALSLYESLGTQLMAGGGLLGKIKGVGSKIAGIADGTMKMMLHPGDALKSILSGSLGGLSHIGNSGLGKVLKAMPKKLLDMLLSGVHKLTSALSAGGGGLSGGSGAPVANVGSGVQRWSGDVLKVLGMLHQPASLLNAVLHRMNQESGGNPNAINNWDSNAAAGDPSRGLMQTIGSTFAAYAGPFAGSGIYNPMANIYAGLNYAMHRYGSIYAAMMKSGGYAAGTNSATPGWHMVGERGPELLRFNGGEKVLPTGTAGGGDLAPLLTAILRQLGLLTDKTPTADALGTLSETQLRKVIQMARAA